MAARWRRNRNVPSGGKRKASMGVRPHGRHMKVKNMIANNITKKTIKIVIGCLLIFGLAFVSYCETADDPKHVFLDRVGFWFEEVGCSRTNGYFVTVGEPFVLPKIVQNGFIQGRRSAESHEVVWIPKNESVSFVNGGRGPDSFDFRIVTGESSASTNASVAFRKSDDNLEIKYKVFEFRSDRTMEYIYLMNAFGDVFDTKQHVVFSVSGREISEKNEAYRRKAELAVRNDNKGVASIYKGFAEAEIAKAKEFIVGLASGGTTHMASNIVCYSKSFEQSVEKISKMIDGRPTSDNIRTMIEMVRATNNEEVSKMIDGRQIPADMRINIERIRSTKISAGYSKYAIFVPSGNAGFRISRIIGYSHGEQVFFFIFDRKERLRWAYMPCNYGNDKKGAVMCRYQPDGECDVFVELRDNVVNRTCVNNGRIDFSEDEVQKIISEVQNNLINPDKNK